MTVGSCSTFAEIATPPGTTNYSDTGLDCVDIFYSYRVRATDAVKQSERVFNERSSATTLRHPLTPQAPTAPSGLSATIVSGTA